MTTSTIRPAYGTWPLHNSRLRDVVAGMTEEQLAISWVHTRGWAIQRVFTHDVWHTVELNEALGNVGLPQIDIWDQAHRREQRRPVRLPQRYGGWRSPG